MKIAINAIGWIMCIGGWGNAAYNVATLLWSVDKGYAVLGAVGCSIIAIECVAKALSGERFWSWS